ncbi:MAG: carboxypeptidase regulatory-like domain-containing protein [Bacteroidetes bacterium]|nr:carboxypeptidase regulatory-like domain-containing protein [Bacteroidota bacterium]
MKRLYTGLALFTLFILLCVSCKKYSESKDDLSGDDYLRGRVFVADSLKGDFVPVYQAGVMVMVSDNPAGTDFLYSASTDSSGYFIFKYLKKGQSYSVYAELIIDSVIYYGRLSKTPDENDIQLVLSPKTIGQSIVSFTVLDPNDQPVQGTNICLYNNMLLSKDTSCVGSIWTGVTNTAGKVSKVNLPAGVYVANFTYAKGQLSYRQSDTFVLYRDSIVARKIHLGTSNVSKTNSIAYMVTDSLGGIIPKCDICGFSSFLLVNDSCKNSNWSIQTDNAGKAVIKDLPTGKYYVYFNVAYARTPLKARDTISTFTDTTKYQKSIIVK